MMKFLHAFWIWGNESFLHFPKDMEGAVQWKNYYYFHNKRSLYEFSSEKAMAPHFSTLAWKIPWMEEPGRLPFMGSLGVGHDWVTSLSLFTFMHWRRKWQPTPVFLPRESQGRGSLVGCHLWDHNRVRHDCNDLAATAAYEFSSLLTIIDYYLLTIILTIIYCLLTILIARTVYLLLNKILLSNSNHFS